MNSQIERLIGAAEADLGYKESPPNSNRTKYGEWYGMNGQPWCMMAVQYWFNEAGIAPLIYRTASCTVLMNWAKQRGKFYTKDFRRGDVVLFNWSGKETPAEHVGIVTGVSSGGVLTIEGNTSVGNDSDGGEVMRRTRSYSAIIGVFRPDYEEDEIVTYEDWKKYMEQYRAELSGKPATLSEFEDAKQAGITDGTRPKDLVTREEAAVMAVRAAKFDEQEDSQDEN